MRKNIITISLWELTNVSIIINGLNANKKTDFIFFEIFETKKIVPR